MLGGAARGGQRDAFAGGTGRCRGSGCTSQQPPAPAAAGDGADDGEDDAAPQKKRPRNGGNGPAPPPSGVAGRAGPARAALSPAQGRLAALSGAAVDFLLPGAPWDGAAGGPGRGAGATAPPLERFQGPGGVMPLVMSLV